MTNSTVPVNVDHHNPVNKGAAEALKPGACQCADATGRVSSLREAEESEWRALTDLPPALTLRRPGPACSECGLHEKPPEPAHPSLSCCPAAPHATLSGQASPAPASHGRAAAGIQWSGLFQTSGLFQAKRPHSKG